MKKKISLFIIALCFILPCMFMCTACNDSNDTCNVFVYSLDRTMGVVYGGGDYAKGEEILIYAEPKEGYEFVNWDDGNTENPRMVSTDNNTLSYAATFRMKTKYAVIESVRLSVAHGYDIDPNGTLSSGDSIICNDWYVAFNGYQYGSTGSSEVLYENSGRLVKSYVLNGCRRSFTSSNGVYYVNNKLAIDTDVSNKISAYVKLNFAGDQKNLTELSLYARENQSIVFDKNENSLTIVYQYPGYGQLAVTFIYHVV